MQLLKVWKDIIFDFTTINARHIVELYHVCSAFQVWHLISLKNLKNSKQRSFVSKLE